MLYLLLEMSARERIIVALVVMLTLPFRLYAWPPVGWFNRMQDKVLEWHNTNFSFIAFLILAFGTWRLLTYFHQSFFGPSPNSLVSDTDSDS